jgi:membrane dipeptidase
MIGTPASSASGTFGAFDFGLGPDDELRAHALHADSVIVDLLCQGPSGDRHFTAHMQREIEKYLATTDDIVERRNFVIEMPIREAIAAGDTHGPLQCWRASGVTAAASERDYIVAADIVKGLGFAAAQFERFPWYVKATEPEHIRAAKREGGVAGFVSSQESAGFGNDLELLERARDLGLAMLQLTYNSRNFVGFGCMEPCDDGLSQFGVRFVRRMNELGIVVDISHCGAQTTLDACARSARPVVASHTSARALFDHPRAKTDEQLKAIAGTGGVIGVYAVPFFLGNGPDDSIELVLDHVEYITSMVGAEHVAIGTDWPLPMPASAIRTIYQDYPYDYTRTLVGFGDLRDWPNITRGLVARGYGDDAIRGILGENFLRVLGEVVSA